MKNFVIVLRLVVHIHALREIGFENLKAWIPKCLPITLFHYYFYEREILEKRDFCLYCSPFFFRVTQSKAEIKLHNHNKKVF